MEGKDYDAPGYYFVTLCADELHANNTSRLIWILPVGMPKRVPVKWGAALLRARALWLSP